MGKVYENIKIEAISLATCSIKFNDGWLPVIGKAKEFLKNYKKDESARIGIENERVFFISKLKSNSIKAKEPSAKPKEEPKPEEKPTTNPISPWEVKQDLILAQACMKVAGQTSNDVDTICENTKKLFAWMKAGKYK